MSSRPWDRDPDTTLSLALLKRVGETQLAPDGRLDCAQFSDCNVFGWQEITRRTGYTNVWRTRELYHNDDRAHYRPIYDSEGREISAATHSNTGQCIGEQWRGEGRAAMVAGKKKPAG